MKTSRIITNGIIIFLGIGIYFLIMDALGLSRNIYLRLLNFVFVFYGVNRTIQGNFREGIDGYFTNLGAAFLTAFTGLVLSVFCFMEYAVYKGGETYLEKLHATYIFGGHTPSPYQFGASLFLEGLAASMVVSFTLMQYWKDKVEKINTIDDAAHNPH